MSQEIKEALLGTTPLPQEVLDMVMEYSTITTYDALRRVVESGNSGKYYFTPSLEECERCMQEGLSLEEYERCMGEVRKFKRLLSKQGFAFHVTLPEGLQYVRDHAFSGCSSITSVTLPEGLQYVGWHAFEKCTRLTSVTFPEGLQYMYESAFRGCSSLTSVTFPEGLRYVGWHAFENCTNLTSVTFPEGFQSLGKYAFRGCSSLTSVTFPQGLHRISEYAFENCTNLTSVTFHEGLQQVQCYHAFYRCWSLQTIYVPENVSLDRGDLGSIRSDVRIVRIRRAPEQEAGSANKRQRTKLRF